MAYKDLIEWARTEAHRLATTAPSSNSNLQETSMARQFFADHAGGAYSRTMPSAQCRV